MGERVCLCVAPKTERPPTLTDITVFMRGQGIATDKLPEALMVLDGIPGNPVGKVLERTPRERVSRDG
ncbi:MAG TPA: hypothetical protein VFA86_10945 [Gammaproteobacteria bacterium]|nr:hypothetical protein [Gammaproteobacteria bacterium]